MNIFQFDSRAFTNALCCSLAAAGVFFAASARAQLPGGGQTGLNAAMLKLFGEFPAFTSKADVRLQEKQSRALTTLATDFAMLDGKVRMELDMASVKSAQIPQQMMDTLKSAGLNKLITVVRPDRKQVFLIYPGARSWAEIPMSKEEAADTAKKFRIEKTKMGKETIAGHPCEKMKVVLRSETGEKNEALVWYATDLGNFPVRIQLDQPDATVVMDYRDVKMGRLDVKQFEAPADFARYNSAEMLMQSVMLKAMGGAK